MENYQVICTFLCVALRQTRQYEGLESLEHVQKNGDRYVIVRFANGHTRKIIVTADSGIAMIRDSRRCI